MYSLLLKAQEGQGVDKGNSGYDENRKEKGKGKEKASWDQLISFATYKAEGAGKIVELVDPKGTSQECFGCGAVVPKTLTVRVHRCPRCGLVMDRDENAARNILARSIHVGQELPESTPVEIFDRRSMKQDAPVFIPG